MPLRDRRRRPLIRRRSLLSRGGHSTGPKEGLQKIKKAIYTAVGQERAIPQTLPIARNAKIFFLLLQRDKTNSKANQEGAFLPTLPVSPIMLDFSSAVSFSPVQPSSVLPRIHAFPFLPSISSSKTAYRLRC
jgi:hypothetical protein